VTFWAHVAYCRIV